ncbi:restriction modification system DNA specificity domain-containing protein [Helicobacter mustelae]|uniref:restriction endonuclease subunit S n=1 Tax=Helicobacter mustelae TaxID=217 RepID=UPI000DFC1831|nr:restriction endonuclease subunit S [Helicobacter mustelae]STP14181.1 restriction modification system DNA specificity domain-containing protein [Helicobacter mustelae]
MKAENITYKECGIAWLGEIPEHWEVVRLKYVATLYTGNSIKDSDKGKYSSKENAIPYIATKDITRDSCYVDYDNGMYVPKNNLDFQRAPKDSTLICIEGGSAGRKLAFMNQEVCFVNKLCCVKSLNEENFYSRIFFYFFQSSFFCQIFHSNLKGLIGGVTTEQIGNFYIPLPPLEEQKAIARFLDEKCAQMDSLIEKKQKLIALLIEQKSALISEVVTKGLDPQAPLKDSTIPWLGQIPEHWEVRKVKYLTTLRNQKAINCDFKIGLENIESKTGKYIQTNDFVFEDDGIKFFEGDILFGKLRPYLAKVFLANKEGICVSEFLVLKSERIYNRYLKFLMLGELFINVVDGSTYGTKMPRANWDFIGNLKIPLPPLEEQKAIAEFLDKKIEEIDSIITKTKEQIKLFKEYKNTLITEATCGRMEIT